MVGEARGGLPARIKSESFGFQTKKELAPNSNRYVRVTHQKDEGR